MSEAVIARKVTASLVSEAEEKNGTKRLLEEFKRVDGKTRLLYRAAEVSLAKPEETV
jgi:hypothetical protein